MPVRPHLLASTLLTLFALLSLFHAVADDAKVRIAVEGARVQFEPATVRLRITVEPDPANRALTVALVSDDYERSSLEQLDGESAPRTRWIEWRAIPAGEYDVLAVVYRPPARPWRVRERLQVLGRY